MKSEMSKPVVRAQTVALGTAFVLLALGALGSIWLFADSAARENASALQIEKSLNQLHIVLRGLNEVVVTQGSSASRDLVKASAREFEQQREGVGKSDAHLLAGWEAIEEKITKFLGDQSNVSFEDEDLISLGRISSAIENIVVAATARAETQRAQAGAAEFRARMVIVAAAVLMLLGTVAILIAFHRTVSRPVEAAIQLAHQVAEGDLSTRLNSESHGQAGRLLKALQGMSEKLGNIVAEVRQGTEAFDQAAAHLASGNQELSRRTERQATALEETAASMEELSTVVTGNAASSKVASQKAAEAKATAIRGGETVGRFLAKMESIAQGSRRMSEIIGTIDAIAFQTNILALNAAVEAARAGDQGRGFAVVAAEVRSLAQRSTMAAKEIKTLILESSEQIDEGATMVESSRQTMQEIGASIGEVSQVMEAISQASEQQASGIIQVSQAVVQMERTVQENSALVERTAAASDSLKERAQSLKQAAAVFKLGDAVGAEPGPATPAPSPRGLAAFVPRATAPRLSLLAVAIGFLAMDGLLEF